MFKKKKLWTYDVGNGFFESYENRKLGLLFVCSMFVLCSMYVCMLLHYRLLLMFYLVYVFTPNSENFVPAKKEGKANTGSSIKLNDPGKYSTKCTCVL